MADCVFMSDANRSDLSGASKLDSVILYSKNASGTLTYLKQNDFYYSYFNSSPYGCRIHCNIFD